MPEIIIHSSDSASAIWATSDRLHFPPDACAHHGMASVRDVVIIMNATSGGIGEG